MTMPKVAYFVIEQTGTDQFRAVSESHDVEVLSDGLGFYSNLQAYPKVLPGAVPAIRFPSGKKPVLPEDTDEDHWHPVSVNGDTFWAYLYKNRDRNTYESKAFNTCGEMSISDGEQHLTLTIETCHFSIEDLNAALEDFKCELLNIVLEESNIFVRANRQDFLPVLSDMAIEAIKRLIRAIENISRNPKSRLSHATRLMNVGRAKPTAKGIRQYFVNPAIRQVDGHVSNDDFDTGENRHVFSTARGLQQFLLTVDALQKHWLSAKREDLWLQEDSNSESLPVDQRQFEDLYWTKHQQVSQKIIRQNVPDLLTKIASVIGKFRGFGVKPVASGFNPMVFAQNPAYAEFQKERARFFEEKLFSSVGMITRLGTQLSKLSIMNLPDFYERWCLVQMINVLVNRFHYEVVGTDWRRKFVAMCLLNRRGIIITLRRTVGRWGDEEKISLSYQEEFVIDGKTIRPDFIIRTDAGTWIADAKFRTHSTNTELMNLCWELAHNKKYNLNSEVPVYLFHCANHAGDDSYKSIFKNSWLPYCNYGSYFNKLQRGHILLTPQSNMKERSIDNLIRWFLMIFQESNQPLCPNCGERLLEYTQNKFKRGFKCPNCGFGSSVGRCLKCKRVFWCNKLYWSYNIFDTEKRQTICPDCAETIMPRKLTWIELYMKDPYRYNIDGEDLFSGFYTGLITNPDVSPYR